MEHGTKKREHVAGIKYHVEISGKVERHRGGNNCFM
jgi:hypothetical protein